MEKGEENTKFEVTMAKVSNANSLDKNGDKGMNDGESLDRYSESYWAEVI